MSRQMARIQVAALFLVACGTGPEEEPVPVAPDRVTTRDGLYVLHLDAVPQPYVAGSESALTLLVTADDVPVEDVQVDVEPWMPDHGHGISPGPVVGPAVEGELLATWVFSMPGDWHLTLTVDGSDGQDEAKVAYVVQ